MIRFILSILAAVSLTFSSAQAQETGGVAWVQLEAQPSLALATQSARNYARQLEDVNGFSLGGGWYGVVLGPYDRADAQTALQVYRRQGLIPRDSFVAETASFGQQFWPIGANTLSNLPAATSPVAEPTPAVSDPVVQPEPEPEPVVADETPRQARASEARLDRDQRKELQIMLQWAGTYTAGIDGAFGPGTRRAMSLWQDANGYEATGVLTTAQRIALKDQYNAVLEGMGLRVVTDTVAGIEMVLPMGIVDFDKYQSPFAHYEPTGELEAKVLLISQEGDQASLFGLYDILQTLEIVPLDGARERKKNSFVLIGENERIVSYTEARLDGGTIKGFTLIWPAGDEERRTRVLEEMKASFTTIDGVMDPVAGLDEDQSVDLVSGLEVRKPLRSRSGFFIDQGGAVVTALEAIKGCGRITLDTEHEAEVVARNDDLGVAVLRPLEALAPAAVAALLDGAPRLKSDVAVAGYSYEGVLGAPTMTYGTLADLRGLQGEERITRLALAPFPGDAGGPVFDAGGSVLGMLLPPPSDGNRQFPGDVSFATDATAIQTLLQDAGIRAATSAGTAPMAPEDLLVHATGMTVLVSCWE